MNTERLWSANIGNESQKSGLPFNEVDAFMTIVLEKENENSV